jgi:hypothetical protein
LLAQVVTLSERAGRRLVSGRFSVFVHR